ncbi:uroporphyrinogen decarboxylase [Candidatus Formimonas warabiya]|uniref:Uroporphyrinogen decarboxylase n=1 Tax=Formimonas warabiya TaxID=1761012 RepID=A0A3G1L1S5_FORW1|nr:uroporphyrinogen decarboxylase [Candidatus Formimonas warabiya]ATW28607.1 uroporphyrinogen decarboxylase [Candidatus Formimonas warabiya]
MNDIFLRACRREQVEYTPVWFMRQAGRYMEEYMKIRKRYSFLEMCKTPELAAQVTLQPVDRLGVDAAILFADILLPLEGMGIAFEFSEGEGPFIHHPVRCAKDVAQIRVLEGEEATPYVMEAIRLARRDLEGKVPLIGFSAAPFTLASYLIEGGGSRDYLNCKKMIWGAPEIWHELMRKVSQVILNYLRAQIAAGAQAVQLFDSWVGTLNSEDYRHYVLPYSQKVITGLKDLKVPVIHFANNGATLLELVKEAGGDVIGIDWRINIDQAWKRLGSEVGIQGNLDPAVLLAPRRIMEQKAKDILDRAANRPGHIFNLGHGIHKDSRTEDVLALVEAVHEYSRRNLKARANLHE